MSDEKSNDKKIGKRIAPLYNTLINIINYAKIYHKTIINQLFAVFQRGAFL
jgi:hypothetical protein